ncbi:MAG: hypothetical protein ACREE3_16425, partial [Stellaceae bacterium]
MNLRGSLVSPAKTESSAPETLETAATGCTRGLISQFDAIGSGAASVPEASRNPGAEGRMTVHLLATPAYADPARHSVVEFGRAENPISAVAQKVSATLGALPPVLIAAILVVGAVVVAVIVQRIVLRAFPSRVRARYPLLGATVERGRSILLAGLVIIMLGSVVPAMPIGAFFQIAAAHVLTAAFVFVLGWAAVLAIDVLAEHEISRHRDNIQADVMARRQATQWQVLRRISRVVIVLLTIGAALLVFPAVRQYGVSMLASAGAAGLVLGFAARPV